MNAKRDPSRSTAFLSTEQIKALEQIAQANHTSSADLVSLAVDALIAEAAHHKGWLPIPAVANR